MTARADVGGGSRHLELLLEQWGAGVEAHVACPRDRPFWDVYRRLAAGRLVEIPHRKFTVPAALRLIRYVRSRDIRIIHAHGKGAGAYARAASLATSIPSLLTPHGIHLPAGAVKRGAYIRYENATARWLRRVVFVSSGERDIAARQGLWPAVPDVVVANGVPEVGEAMRADLRERGLARMPGIPGPIAISVLRSNYQKNPEALLQLAHMLPGMSFVLVGTSREQLVRQLGRPVDLPNVHVLGEVGGVMELLAAADVLVSAARWEGMPLSILEAMSVGLPVLASDIPGHRDIVRRGLTGDTFPLHDLAAAARKLADLAGDPDLRTALGTAARELQRTSFTVRRMAAETLSVYRGLDGQRA